MAKRLGGFVVNNREIQEKWEQLLALQETPLSTTDSGESEGPGAAKTQAESTEVPTGSSTQVPGKNPAEGEPDPHANIGEPVPIVKVVPKG